ncbi:MAG: biopolymer transport protein ExbD [Abditibacteriota bacterium]|nr:biopolymer transport protein ExbD [Abditibacteriota bacterium]
MKFKPRRELKRTKIEIIPMIDTIFFLLVFFMLSSLALTRLNGLPVNLPESKTAPAQPPTELTVTITQNGRLLINNESATWNDFQRKLTEKAGGPRVDLTQVSVIINADERVPHGIVVRAIDYARDMGITRYGIATAPSQAAR